MKTWIAAIVMGSFVGLVSAAPDELEDAYNQLKAAESKKDADGVRKWAAETSKLGHAAAAAPQPASAEEIAVWKQRVGYANDVDTYAEYALATTAAQPGIDPAKVVELVDQLVAQNPKSKYVDTSTPAYLVALETLSANLSGKSPDRALTYANKLVSVARARNKPEGVAEADWERVKNGALGTGYYLAGAIHAQKQAWVDCDRELKDALPLISKDPARLGPAYFYLGLCNYQLGRLTQDRSKIMAGEKYSEQSAAIPGPMQSQASQNALSMKRELGGPATKR